MSMILRELPMSERFAAIMRVRVLHQRAHKRKHAVLSSP
jgi:hypothetical protein